MNIKRFFKVGVMALAALVCLPMASCGDDEPETNLPGQDGAQKPDNPWDPDKPAVVTIIGAWRCSENAYAAKLVFDEEGDFEMESWNPTLAEPTHTIISGAYDYNKTTGALILTYLADEDAEDTTVERYTATIEGNTLTLESPAKGKHVYQRVATGPAVKPEGLRKK